eukprot:TRINITY_DN12569_c0_g1_i14.p2 TRINITY_DN12569_c0_g1~~TRINITY_DN12569_c0_g1_i14.p2  ORF type:complete len:298 (+),score=79.41 TRINITY_DN12569_c0_g1_i14:988-1881(+)
MLGSMIYVPLLSCATCTLPRFAPIRSLMLRSTRPRMSNAPTAHSLSMSSPFVVQGASFGYHPGGWGKPPVDAAGKPLYGDVFGTYDPELKMQGMDLNVDKTQWGKMESEGEASSSEEEDDSDDEQEKEGSDMDEDNDGLETPSGIISEAPSGISSVGVGMETPNAVELRKRKAIEEAMDNNTTGQTLYKVIPQREASASDGMMGSTHVYDVNAAAPATGMASGTTSVAASEGVAISLDNPEDVGRLESNQEMLAQKLAASQSSNREDHSDMVAEHQAKSAAKRKKAADKTQSKKFKF